MLEYELKRMVNNDIEYCKKEWDNYSFDWERMGRLFEKIHEVFVSAYAQFQGEAVGVIGVITAFFYVDHRKHDNCRYSRREYNRSRPVVEKQSRPHESEQKNDSRERNEVYCLCHKPIIACVRKFNPDGTAFARRLRKPGETAEAAQKFGRCVLKTGRE